MFQFVRGYNVSSYEGIIGANCILMGSLVNGGIRKGTHGYDYRLTRSGFEPFSVSNFQSF